MGDLLVDRGSLARTDTKVLGVFSSTRWPERDSELERSLRVGLANVLVDDVPPTCHQAMLVPVLTGLKLVPTLVATADRKNAMVTASRLTAAAKMGELTSATVSQAVQVAQAAIMATFVGVAVVPGVTAGI